MVKTYDSDQQAVNSVLEAIFLYNLMDKKRE